MKLNAEGNVIPAMDEKWRQQRVELSVSLDEQSAFAVFCVVSLWRTKVNRFVEHGRSEVRNSAPCKSLK